MSDLQKRFEELVIQLSNRNSGLGIPPLRAMDDWNDVNKNADYEKSGFHRIGYCCGSARYGGPDYKYATYGKDYRGGVQSVDWNKENCIIFGDVSNDAPLPELSATRKHVVIPADANKSLLLTWDVRP